MFVIWHICHNLVSQFNSISISMEKVKSYKEIRHLYTNPAFQIPYVDQLRLKEWRDLRETVLDRDKNTCTECGRKQSPRYRGIYYRVLSDAEIIANERSEKIDLAGDGSLIVAMKTARVLEEPTKSPVILHIHHTYYIHGDLAWEYPLDSLKTLCHECHFELHSKTWIPVYTDVSKREQLPLTPCTRCHGTGFLKQFYYHLNGICFRCNGRKFEEYISQPRF